MAEPPRRSLTMQEIARAAGVSPTTVSHALSGNRPVNPATAQRIREIIDSLGYVPDAAARRLKSGRSRVIALAIPDISNSYFGTIARGVEEVTDSAGYGLIVCSTSNSDPRKERRYFELVREHTVDGLVYTAGRDVQGGEDLMKVARTAPVVFADELVQGALGPSVSSANYGGAKMLAAHLRAAGHRRVAIVSGFPDLDSTRERLRGACEIFPTAHITHGDFTWPSGYAATARLLEERRSFTAILALNDLMATGAIRRLREAGLAVPGDVSVVGFDDIEIASLISPPLTTVRQDVMEIGRVAARMMIQRLQDGGVDQGDVVLPVTLIERESVAPPRESG